MSEFNRFSMYLIVHKPKLQLRTEKSLGLTIQMAKEKCQFASFLSSQVGAEFSVGKAKRRKLPFQFRRSASSRNQWNGNFGQIFLEAKSEASLPISWRRATFWIRKIVFRKRMVPCKELHQTCTNTFTRRCQEITCHLDLVIFNTLTKIQYLGFSRFAAIAWF